MSPKATRRPSSFAQSIAAGAMTITLVTIVVRILGLVRWGAQAGNVGSVGVAEAYATANLIPNVLFEVVAGGALAGAIVPLLAGPIVARKLEKTTATVAALLTWTVAVLSALAILTAVFAPEIIAVIPRVNDPNLRDLAIYFLRVFAVQLPLYGISVVLSGVLQAHRKFWWPALAPGLSSLVVIITYVGFGRLAHGLQRDPAAIGDGAIAWLAWGTTLGVAALSLPLVVPVRQLGIRLRPSWRLPQGQGRTFLKLASAGIAGLIAQQVAIAVVMFTLNAQADPGAYPVWQYAQAVAMMVFAIVAVPIATSAFPTLSELYSQQRTQDLIETAASAWRVCVVFVIAAVSAVVCTANPIEAFFGFTHGGVADMNSAVMWLAYSMIPMAFSFFMARILYAIHQPRAGATGLVIGWGLTALLAAVVLVSPDELGTPATFTWVGVAHVIGLSIGMLVHIVSLGRALTWRIFTAPSRSVLIAVVTAVVLIAGANLIVPQPDALSITSGLVWIVIIAIPVFAVISAVGLIGARASLSVLFKGRRVGDES